ncbi:MAG: ABC transporter permease subunit, partial [Actinobacteria bacterium]|nr:ABC transporter permease subunit [Actinomycetota bacterium]
MNRVESRTPRFVVLGAALGVLFLGLPILGLMKRVVWSSLWSQLTDAATLEALRISLYASVCATAIALVLGLPLAWVLARMQLKTRRIIRALILLPMVLPPVVGGVALLGAYGKSNGLLGGVLNDKFGIQLTYSLWGVVIAEAFVALPFLVLALEGGLRAIDTKYEESAAVMGAGDYSRFRLVVLPLLRPSLAAGLLLAWARALGEFGATITFAGNIQGRTQTTPLA